MNTNLCLGLACVVIGAGQAAVAPLKVELVSAPLVVAGQPGTGNGISTGSIISGDGRVVVFTSGASNLTTNDLAGGVTGSFLDAFARDTQGRDTQLVSVNLAGTKGGNGDSFVAGLSRDGRYVLFESVASDLAANDRNAANDIFVRDLALGVTMLVSVNATGDGSGNGESVNASISRDGRYVVFESDATNLVTGDTNGVRDVFLRDLVAATTTLISRSTNGALANGASSDAVLSADGSTIVFLSAATNLTAGDTNKLSDIFIRDTRSNSLVNLTGRVRAFSTPGSESYSYAISGDGHRVTFRSGDGTTAARNPDDGSLYWWNLQAGTNSISRIFGSSEVGTLKLSEDGYVAIAAIDGVASWRDMRRGGEGTGITPLYQDPTTLTYSRPAAFNVDMSPDGRWVVFMSTATNLAVASASTEAQIYVRDMTTNVFQLVTIHPDGGLGTGNDIAIPSISDDGRRVAFDSLDARLAAVDLNRTYDVFVRDMQAGSTALASVARPGTLSLTGDGSSRFEPSAASADGRFLIFSSTVETLVTNDNNGLPDIFLFDREHQSNLLVSVNLNGTGSANGGSSGGILSANGQVAGFFSTASNLTSDKTNSATDFYVRDLARGVTRRIVPPVVTGAGTEGITSPVLSGDGRYLAFLRRDRLFRLDLTTDTLTNVIQASTGALFNISDDGRWIAVSGGSTVQQQLWDGTTGKATRLTNSTPALAVDNFRFAAGGAFLFFSYPQNGSYQIVSVDLTDLHQAAVSLKPSGQPQLSPYKPDQSVSADGNLVAFVSADDGLTASDTNKLRDVFVRDRHAGKTVLVSVNAAGTASGNGVSDNPSISADGRFVLFRSEATDLVSGELVTAAAIFVRDLQTGVTRLVNRNYAGTGGSSLRVGPPMMSADGSTAYFTSLADDLIQGDSNTQQDIFFVRLDIGTTGTIDSDGDGLPDDWERQYFGDLTHDGSGDFDGDGFSDSNEFGAGTNPTNRDSALRVELIHVAEMDWSLRWATVTGKTYRIQRRFSLSGGAWTDLPGETAGNGAVVSVQLPAVIDAEGGFFRVVVR